MIYVYDRIIDKNDTILDYYGDIYKLQAATRTQNGGYYYTYTQVGGETILVIPLFATQFLEAAKKVSKLKDCTTDRTIRLRLERTFQTKPGVSSYQFDGKTTYEYEIDYKSIRIYMGLTEKGGKDHFFLMPVFSIEKDNIFGAGISVSVRENEALYKYCEES